MAINIKKYDFVDFGCSVGRSMKFAQTVWSVEHGIGIDRSPYKVRKTQDQGFEAEVADLTSSLNFSGQTRFSILSHILEHIPDMYAVEDILNTASTISSEFVFVRQPWFDSDGPLAELGLKMFWSDWKGHPNRMTSLEMYLILKRQLDAEMISGFSIWGLGRVPSSVPGCIIPLDSGSDRKHYNPETDPPKEKVKFDFPCFQQLVAYIGVSPDLDVTTLPATLPHPYPEAKMLFSKSRV